MAECNESDEEFFITQSKFKSRGVGSDTDDVLSGILDLEERIREDKSEDLFSDNSSVEQELLTSTVQAENELLRERFACPHGEKDLENILVSAKSKSTESKTRWAVNLFSKWQRARSGNEKGERFNTPLLEMTNEELGKALSYFIVEVRNEAGKEYRPNTVYEIIISIQHHLRSSGKFVNFLDDNAFAKMKAILDAKMKSLSKQGLGIDKKQADIISMEQEEILWSRGILGSDNPRQLLNTMVYLIGLNFALRAGQEHRNLRFGKDSQISLKRDSCGRRYLQYTEDISKTNTGGLQHRKLAPKSTRAYESEIKERCIVTLYLKYIGARPQEGKTEAFYLRPKANMDGRCWYMDAPVGVHTLQQVVKKMCSEAGFEGQYTNHSLRATAATRLYGAGVDEQLIAEKTGHRSSSVRGYKRTSDEQQHRLSKILHGNDERNDYGEKELKNANNEGNLKSTEVRIEAGSVKIRVVKF